MTNQLFITLEMSDMEVMNRIVASCDRISRIRFEPPRVNSSKVRSSKRTMNRAKTRKSPFPKNITVTKNRYGQ